MKKICLQCKSLLKTKDAKKFCSRSCAATFNNKNRRLSEKTKHKIKNGVLQHHKEHYRKHRQYMYICDKCSKKFTSAVYMRKSRPTRCSSCKRVTKRGSKSASSILELSKRTISKLMKRAKFSCSMCGWNKTSLDLHHIVYRSIGGGDKHQNLIALCPNCHRMAHEEKYSINALKINSLDKSFPDWKDYYLV